MPRGGARPNTGPKKGSHHKATLDKLAQKEAFRQVVFKHQEALLSSAIASAKGIQHFVLRDKKTGKFEKVTSEQAAIAVMNDPESVYEFWTRDPSIAAFAYLFDQALDKAAQPQKLTGPEGGAIEVVLSWKK
jgi:hypothetical protein